MLETETRSKNGCKKQHFGHALDFENQVAHLNQEFLGVFLILFKLTCCAILQSFDLILPHLEPISTVFTNIVHSLHFIPSLQSAVNVLY